VLADEGWGHCQRQQKVWASLLYFFTSSSQQTGSYKRLKVFSNEKKRWIVRFSYTTPGIFFLQNLCWPNASKIKPQLQCETYRLMPLSIHLFSHWDKLQKPDPDP
jgi:hypothetical protein